jgi:hypothetical protein
MAALGPLVNSWHWLDLLQSHLATLKVCDTTHSADFGSLRFRTESTVL